MTEPLADLTGSALAAEEAYRRTVGSVTGQVDNLAQRFLTDGAFLNAPDQAAAIATAVASITPMVEAGQHTVADLTNAHVSQAFGVTKPPPVDPQVFGRPGVSLDQEYARPFWTAIQKLRGGATVAEALAAGSKRMNGMVDTDMQMAKVRQSSAVVKASGVTHYRRISRAGACPLCQIASTAIYHKKTLLPIHTHCHCSVGPLPEGGQGALDDLLDPEALADGDDQKRLLRKAADDDVAAKGYRDLTAVHEHGEVGPMLGWKHQNFETPAQMKAREPVHHNLQLDQQVYDIVRAHDGVTIDLGGNQPVEGYAYAPFKGTEVTVPLADFTPEHVDRYIEAHFDELAKPGNHLGLWVQDDHVYIDVSKVGPPTAATLATAQQADQLAVFDLREFEEIHLGTVDEKGVYTARGKATDIHSEYQGQVQGAAQARSAGSPAEVSTGSRSGTTGLDPPPHRIVVPQDEYSSLATEVDGTWLANGFDYIKDGIRDGAQRALTNGYDGPPKDLVGWKLDRLLRDRKNPLGQDILGGELVARAVHSEPTTKPLWRGVAYTPEYLATLKPGSSVALPLSSFTPNYASVSGFVEPEVASWSSGDRPENGVPVLIKLESGAKVAALGVNPDLNPANEHVAFGEFEIVSVTPDTSFRGGGPTEVVIRQTSLVPKSEWTYDGVPPAQSQTSTAPPPVATPPVARASHTDETMAAAAKLRKAHPGLSVRLDQKKMHPTVATDVTRALDDMLVKYPHSRLKLVTAEDLYNSPNTFAQTLNDIARGDSKVTFNQPWVNTADAKLSTAYAQDVAAGYHPRIGAESPAYAVAVHEFAHTLDTTGGLRARGKLNETLAEAYRQLKPKVTFNEWRAQQFSGYSFLEKTARPDSVPDPPEMLAEAFADVELNGDRATDGAKALHAMLVRESALPLGTATSGSPSRLVNALERRRITVDTTPLPWTDADYAKVDNAALTAEQRADARAAAEQKYRDSSKIEPPITAAITATVEASGGQMYGLAHRLKEAPSLYRKAQDEMVTGGLTAQEAVDKMRDTVRYTAIVPEADYWKSGNDLRDALVSLGAEPVKQPTGVSYSGYRGRNMTFKMHGTEFEVQVHTAKSMAVKDVNHETFEVARASTTGPELKAALEAKMQRLWDTIPIGKGTPVIRKEKDLKVWFTAKNTKLRGPTVPIIHDETGKVHLPYGAGKGKHPPIETMRKNTLDADMAGWNRLTPNQQIEGIQWYPKLRWFLAENSRGTRFAGDIDRAMSMYAALSPRMDFDVNYAAVTKALRMTPEELAASTIKDFPGEFGANVDRLKRVAASDDPVWEMRGNTVYSERQIASRKGTPEDPYKDPAGWHDGKYRPLESPKIWNHTKNGLAIDDLTAVTIDTWQARVALAIRNDGGEARRVLDGGKVEGSTGTDAKQPEKNEIYEEFAEAVRQATADANRDIHPEVLAALKALGYDQLMPYHLQAATWTASRQGAF